MALNASQSSPAFYYTGGSLHRDAPSYVTRRADAELLEGLLTGNFCYVLTSRQMGKSSLMVRTTVLLREQGIAVAVLDLTAIGQNLTPEQWYDGLLSLIGEQLGLEEALEDFWQAHEQIAPMRRFFRALREVVLEKRESRVVLLVDEIDAVLSLAFSADEFFAGIRECYNRRAQDSQMNRLTFGLFGVATPADLIRDTRTTPFNIGKHIKLTDFTAEEVRPLAQGLDHRAVGAEKVQEENRPPHAPRRLPLHNPDTGEKLLQRVLYWTGGHPYLTQRLCRAVAEDASAHSPADVDRHVAALFFTTRARETDDNLLFVRRWMLESGADVASLLHLYEQVWKHKRVQDDETNPLVTTLLLSGIVRIQQGVLVVRNRLYERAFNRTWSEANMPDAERRRQQDAYRKGLFRAIGVSSVVVALVGALALAALHNSRLAAQNAQNFQTALLLSRRAESDARKAETLARGAEGRARQSAGERQKALEVARTRQQEAESARKQALASAKEAKRQQVRLNQEARRTRLANAETIRQRNRAEQEAETNRRNLYVARMNQAQQAYQAKEYWRSIDLLESLRPASGQADLRGFEWRYLWYLCRDRSERTFRHTDNVTGLAIAPNGRFIVTGCDDKAVHLWDVATGQKRAVMRGHDGWVDCVAISPDSKLAASGALEGAVNLWSLPTGRLLRTIAAHAPNFRVRCLRFSPDGQTLASAGWDGFIKLWNVETGRLKAQFSTAPINSFAYHPDGKTIVVGTFRGSILFLNSETLKQVKSFQAHAERVWTVALSEDGKWLATGDWANIVKLWEVETQRELAELKSHTSYILSLAFAPGGKTLASSSFDNTIRLWDIPSGKERQTLRGHKAPVETIQFSPDGKWLASVSKDQTAKLWSLETGAESYERELPATTYRVAPDADKYAYTARDGTLQLASLASGRKRILPDKAQWFDFDSRSKILAATNVQYTITLQDIGRRKKILSLRLPETVVTYSVSESARWLCAFTNDNRLHLWNLSSGKVNATLPLPLSVQSLAVSPEGKAVVMRGYDQVTKTYWARLWKTDTLTTALLYQGTDACSLQGFSNDGAQTSLYIRARSQVRQWNVASQQEVSPIAIPPKAMYFDLTPDGKFLATANTDQTLSLWDRSDRREILSLKQTEAVESLALAPDAKFLATRGFAGTTGEQIVTLWDLTAKQARVIRRGVSSVHIHGFLRNGKALGLHLYDRTAQQWDTRLYDIATGKETLLYSGQTDLEPDEEVSRGYLVERNAALKLWDCATGRKMASHPLPQGAEWRLAGDGRTLIVYDNNAFLSYDLTTGRRIARAEAKGPVETLAALPGGKMLLTYRHDRLWRTQLVDMATGRATDLLTPYGSRDYSKSTRDWSISPDGSYLALQLDRKVVVWNAAAQRKVGDFTGHTDQIETLRFSPDSHLLATAGFDRTIRVINVAANREIGVLKGHTVPLLTLCFSPDGKTLASCDMDKTLKLWSLTAMQEVSSYPLDYQPTAMRFSADGALLVMESGDNTLRFLRATPFANARRSAAQRQAKR